VTAVPASLQPWQGNTLCEFREQIKRAPPSAKDRDLVILGGKECYSTAYDYATGAASFRPTTTRHPPRIVFKMTARSKVNDMDRRATRMAAQLLMLNSLPAHTRVDGIDGSSTPRASHRAGPRSRQLRVDSLQAQEQLGPV